MLQGAALLFKIYYYYLNSQNKIFLQHQHNFLLKILQTKKNELSYIKFKAIQLLSKSMIVNIFKKTYKSYDLSYILTSSTYRNKICI